MGSVSGIWGGRGSLKREEVQVGGGLGAANKQPTAKERMEALRRRVIEKEKGKLRRGMDGEAAGVASGGGVEGTRLVNSAVGSCVVEGDAGGVEVRKPRKRLRGKQAVVSVSGGAVLVGVGVGERGCTRDLALSYVGGAHYDGARVG